MTVRESRLTAIAALVRRIAHVGEWSTKTNSVQTTRTRANNLLKTLRAERSPYLTVPIEAFRTEGAGTLKPVADRWMQCLVGALRR